MNRRAHMIDICVCQDPQCGVHIIALDEDGEPIVEISQGIEATRSLMEALRGILYQKAVEAGN